MNWGLTFVPVLVPDSAGIVFKPALGVSSRLSVFPGSTESGRTRAQLDLSLRWDVITDLFWDLSYYNSYDTDPPSSSNSTSDYGVITSIGYSF